MRDLSPFWYSLGETGEEYHLRPLDMPTHWELQASMIGRRVPPWDAVESAMQSCVLGWRGVKRAGEDLPFSPAAKAEALAPSADREWMLRWMAICGELLRRATVTDDEAKKS